MDNGFEAEQFVERVREAIRDADVLSVFFVRVGHSLILDLRADQGDPPAVFLDSMVSTPRERLLSFRRLRPNMPLPEELTLAPWIERVADFRREGLASAMVERCRQAGGDQLAATVTEKYRQLVQLESETHRALIHGDGMFTVWQRPHSDHRQEGRQ